MDNERITGSIKWFDSKKGFGFVQTDDGREVFLHFSSIIGRGYRTVEAGERVEFEVEDTAKGPTAKALVRLGHPQPTE